MGEGELIANPVWIPIISKFTDIKEMNYDWQEKWECSQTEYQKHSKMPCHIISVTKIKEKIFTGLMYKLFLYFAVI